ncbi:MAG: IclR family transcriptional regulator [Deltaproteobacteria bacterium]|nr:IclR family transcriptional regulator [Deltaproteobacteria bacterium]
MAAQGDRYLINSVLRAAQILESFSFEKTSYTNTELSKKLGLNKSTLTRLLCSLEKSKFLMRDSKTGEYRLTHKLYGIASVYLSQLSLHNEAMPLLSDLAHWSGETVHLAVLDEFDVLYIDKIESPQSIGMKSRIGMRVPAYCTAVGKILLAHLEEDRLEALLRSAELKAHTPKTITDPQELKGHLSQIRKQGYAVDNSEHETEVKCVAAPVRDNTGLVVAAISISAPVFRMTKEKTVKASIAAVMETASKISGRLGFLANSGQPLEKIRER